MPPVEPAAERHDRRRPRVYAGVVMLAAGCAFAAALRAYLGKGAFPSWWFHLYAAGFILASAGWALVLFAANLLRAHHGAWRAGSLGVACVTVGVCTAGAVLNPIVSWFQEVEVGHAPSLVFLAQQALYGAFGFPWAPAFILFTPQLTGAAAGVVILRATRP